ncbi:MAG: outer membrane lipoprotein-sorting protein, partial [Gemmatimonadota bacterium]
LAEPGERYDAELEGTDVIDGIEMNVLNLTPRVSSPYRRARIWIDPESDLIRKLEILEESESIRTVELSGMRLDPDLSRARFRFDPPPDVQVIRR